MTDERFAAALGALEAECFNNDGCKQDYEAARADVIALHREALERAEAAERQVERWLTFLAMTAMNYPTSEHPEVVRKIIAAVDAEPDKDPYLRSLRETIRAAMAAGGQ